MTSSKRSKTYQISLYLSGPVEVAKQIIREVCLTRGLCVTVTPTQYVYTGGEEAGYVVGLLNYPRFPCTKEVLAVTAKGLCNNLMRGTFQKSALMVTKRSSVWFRLGTCGKEVRPMMKKTKKPPKK